MRLYALLDRKQREFGTITRHNNDEVACRSLHDVLEDLKGTPLYRYPQDFDLMCLGTFDVQSGVIVPLRVPRFVQNVEVIFKSGTEVPRESSRMGNGVECAQVDFPGFGETGSEREASLDG